VLNLLPHRLVEWQFAVDPGKAQAVDEHAQDGKQETPGQEDEQRFEPAVKGGAPDLIKTQNGKRRQQRGQPTKCCFEAGNKALQSFQLLLEGFPVVLPQLGPLQTAGGAKRENVAVALDHRAHDWRAFAGGLQCPGGHRQPPFNVDCLQQFFKGFNGFEKFPPARG